MAIDLTTTAIEDAVEKIVVAATDRRPALAALTGRASKNVVPWDNVGAATLPVVSFVVQTCPQVGATTYHATLGIAGFAATTEQSRCRAMLREVVAGLQATGLAAIAAPLGPIDGIAGAPVPQSVPSEPLAEGEPPPARADVTLTLTLWL